MAVMYFRQQFQIFKDKGPHVSRENPLLGFQPEPVY